jgi:hypothetical protein
MKNSKIYLTVFFLVFPVLLWSQTKWQKIVTVEDFYKAYPEQIKTMLDQFNLDFTGMDKVKQAYQNNDIQLACTELLNYYKTGNTAEYLRKPKPAISSKTDAVADTILKNVFVVQNVRGQVPWSADGHRNWYYKGPNNDREWAWLSNRHSQLLEVYNVYLETGNPKYAKYIDLFLRDFIMKSMPYPAEKGSESIWRGLEVAARVKVWSQIFYGLINNENISQATQLLMLRSLADHAHYNRHFHAANNWLTMEISALATVATNFPEYKNAPEWLDYSIETMSESMKGQVYADGIQTELTSHYHNVALANFVLFKEICDRANKPLPEFFNKTIENMYSYIAHAVRPDGFRILNNDGDRGSDRDLIIAGAKKFNHPEWEYIATNGTSGLKPRTGPSYFFPWAGQLISRSGFDADAQWSCFDVGPGGSGHQHNDKMHISISAFGRDLLVDAGRFAYTGEVAEKFRFYAKGTQGHNSVLIDGKGQEPDVLVTDKPLNASHFKIAADYDYAWNSFNKYFDLENVKHKRSLFYVRDEFWVVVDNLQTDAPRKIETLWHWHPDCEVYQKPGGIISTNNERGNLQVIPVGKSDWKVDLVKGQEKPEIQGWYSPEYNKFEVNTAAIYSTQIVADATFVWLLMPFENEVPKIEAKVVSKNESEIKLEVTNPEQGKWIITIPFSNSRNTKLEFAKN